MKDIFQNERDELERENWAAAIHSYGPGDEEEEDDNDEETGE